MKIERATDNAALALKIYEAFNDNDLERAISLATHDVEISLIAFGRTFRGHDGFRDFMQGFKTAFPNIAMKVTHQVATDDQVVNEFTWARTHTGPLMTPNGEVPPTGRSVSGQGCEVWQIRNGKLANLRNYQDSASIMKQLGLID